MKSQRKSLCDNARDSSSNRVAKSSHDQLTGLVDRAGFVAAVDRGITRGRIVGGSVAVIAVDIDHFHILNDELGHDCGDEALISLAERLQVVVGEVNAAGALGDCVTRVGADNFLIMSDTVGDQPAADVAGACVQSAIKAPMSLAEHPVALTASIGIAISNADSDAHSLIVDAQTANRRANELGGSRCELFTDELRETTRTADALRHALDNDELRLIYQPKICLITDRIVGVEALLRWERPGFGLLQPSEFIPAAELSEVIVPIGAWVLREACCQAATWHAAHPRNPVQVAVNVAACQFTGDLADVARAAIAESGVDASTIRIEMTETTVMSDIDATVEILGELKRLGITASIDDFGTGYSSLQYLHRLPIDEVKIDRTFVAGLGSTPQDTAIVASVISLAHAMDLDVVAEGVEKPGQLERLRSLGCDFAQGYFIARPVPASEIDLYLAADAAGAAIISSTSDTAATSARLNDTVLIVDDSADVRLLATMSLTAAGFLTDEAASGEAALAIAARTRPGCVLLDVRMPGMSGMDACRGLRADPRNADCTIVMLAASADAADKAEAFLSGADDYIVKPFTPRDLTARIRSAVRRRRATIDTPGTQTDSMLFEMLSEARARAADDVLPDGELMTSRQLEIVKRLLAGDRVPGIARALYVSQSTVRNHLSNIFQRLGVHSQEELLIALRERRRELRGRLEPHDPSTPLHVGVSARPATPDLEVRCALQPILDVRSGMVVGLEVIDPSRDHSLLDESCLDAAAWSIRPGLTISVPVSTPDLTDPGFAASLLELLRRHDLTASSMSIIVSDSAALAKN